MINLIKQSHFIPNVLLNNMMMMMTLDNINTVNNNLKVIRIYNQTIKIVIHLSETLKYLI